MARNQPMANSEKSYLLKRTLFILLQFFFFFAQFADAQERSLDYYLQTGLTNSILVKDIRNQEFSAHFDSLLIECGYKPHIDLSSQAMLAPHGKYAGYDEAITNGGNYAALVIIKQPLFNKRFRAEQLQSLQLIRESLELNKGISNIELAQNITAQYITVYADFQLQEYNRKAIELLNSEKAVVDNLIREGIYLVLDGMNLQSTLSQLQVKTRQIRIQSTNDLSLLNLLCGLDDTSAVPLSKPKILLKDNSDYNTLPFMVQSRIDSLKILNSKENLANAYRPKLEAFADAGFMAIDPLNIPFNFGASLGLNLAFPLYDGRQREKELKKLDLTENTRILYRDYYSKQYLLKYRNLLHQLRLDEELIGEIKNQQTQQEDLIKMYRNELEMGLVRLTDFITTVSNYADILYSLEQAETDRLQIINQLNYLK